MFLLLPLFIQHLGGDELTIGLVLGVGMAVSVAARAPDRHPSRPDRAAPRPPLGRRPERALLPALPPLDTTGPGLYALATIHLVIGGALAAFFTYATDIVPATRRPAWSPSSASGMAPNGLGPALGEELIARRVPVVLPRRVGLRARRRPGDEPLPERRPVTETTAPPTRGTVRDLWHTVLHGGLLRVMVATVVFGAGINVAFTVVLSPATWGRSAPPFYAAYASTTVGPASSPAASPRRDASHRGARVRGLRCRPGPPGAPASARADAPLGDRVRRRPRLALPGDERARGRAHAARLHGTVVASTPARSTWAPYSARRSAGRSRRGLPRMFLVAAASCLVASTSWRATRTATGPSHDSERARS